MKRPEILPPGVPITEAYLRGLVQYVRSLEIQSGRGYGRDITMDGTVLHLWGGGRGTGAGASTWDLWGYALSGTSLTIRTRAIRLHAVRTYRVAEQTITLTGHPCWVVCAIARGATITSVAPICLDAEPASDASYLYVPLFNFVFEAGRYVLEEPCVFDVHFDVPAGG